MDPAVLDGAACVRKAACVHPRPQGFLLLCLLKWGGPPLAPVLEALPTPTPSSPSGGDDACCWITKGLQGWGWAHWMSFSSPVRHGRTQGLGRIIACVVPCLLGGEPGRWTEH